MRKCQSCLPPKGIAQAWEENNNNRWSLLGAAAACLFLLYFTPFLLHISIGRQKKAIFRILRGKEEQTSSLSAKKDAARNLRKSCVARELLPVSFRPRSADVLDQHDVLRCCHLCPRGKGD